MPTICALPRAERVRGDPTQHLKPELQLDHDRYLLAFDSREVPAYRYDLVVLGGGIAGSTAALEAARRGLTVALLAKADLSESNTRYAQGGLAAVLDPVDSFAAHIADTLEVGCGLCDPRTVERVVRGGPEAVRSLLAIGTQLDREANGDFLLSREGGHSFPRIVHAHGDATGIEFQRALRSAVEAEERITAFPGSLAIDLLTSDDGRAAGVLTRTSRGDLVAFCASDVLFATGGSGQIYRETTNPPVATGDGVAIASRAGAALRDLEFVQFHPTCLYIAGAARVLISEIVRGAGGILRDKDGVRFMPEYHAAAELAPRDVVSRAVFTRMVETQDTNVYLDLTEIDGDPHLRFPGIGRVCELFGIDIARDLIPVRPGAHYQIGGIAVDVDGRSSLPGLWAVGEVAATGLHGANRMGSNSLLEGLVLGRRAGVTIAEERTETPVLRRFQGAPRPRRQLDQRSFRVNVEDLTYSLKSMMWREMGVQRTAEGLAEAAEKLGFWSRVVHELAERDPSTIQLLNMLSLSRLATASAAFREESRGVHFRSDFPAVSDDWRVHTVLTPTLEGDRVSRIAIDREAVLSTETATR